jgi:hypothetical protein
MKAEISLRAGSVRRAADDGLHGRSVVFDGPLRGFVAEDDGDTTINNTAA